ncbi:MAG TPA: rod shape-determining protein [Candidatus Coproplasma excrementipullorum]|nr:rod shape-determining protein [Candidatus Coproplasma excrementipullorum]
MMRLAIDIGSFITKIYMPGCGVVLAEATCVAVEREGDEVHYKAFGDRARALSGKAAQNTRIINPVTEGDIAHPRLLSALLEYFLEKVEVPRRKAKNCEVMFVLPCGAKQELKEKYLDVAYDCGIGRTCFTQTPFAAVLGHNVTLSETTPVFCLDIGYGITNIAVVSLDGIIAGLSVNLGGGNIDVHLMDYMAEEFRLKIGALTAERLKNTVGSLLEDDNKMTVVDGRSLDGGTPSSVAVNSSQIEEVITLYVDKILEYVTLVMSKLPAEVASAVMHGGIYLSGGLAKMDGLPGYISKKLGIAVNESEEPSLCAVIGGGMILSSDYLRAALATSD